MRVKPYALLDRLLLGGLGVGSSRRARGYTTFPEMRVAEALETTRNHRADRLTGNLTVLVTTRPFRAPHHTISDVGLLGGGPVPMQGDRS